MTPALYRKLAISCKSTHGYEWIGVITGVLMCFSPFMAALNNSSSYFIESMIFFGFGIIGISWGLLLSRTWFLDTDHGFLINYLKRRFPEFSRRFGLLAKWYGSVFLTVWFFVGVCFVCLGVIVVSAGILIY